MIESEAPFRIRKAILAVVLFVLAFTVPMCITLALTDAWSANATPPESGVMKVVVKQDLTKPKWAKSHRLVLPINTDDPTTMRAVISTSLHLTKHYQALKEGFEIEIVAYNAGIHMFRIDTSPLKDQLQLLRLVNPGIRFVVCEATKLGMESGEGHIITLIENTQLVPSGPAHIIDLQEAGWSYIRS